MDPNLQLKLSPEKRITMTFALRQALEILQMPQIELAQWLSQEIEKNPLLQEIESPRKTIDCKEIPSPISLYDHLMSQLRESLPLISHRQIAKAFLNHLDEKGFLCASLEELCDLYQQPLILMEQVLKILQTFDPPGIFARNLQETLLLQLIARGEKNTPQFFLVRDCFDDLVNGRYTSIKKKLGSIDLTNTIQKLARLSLRPAEAFKQEVVPTIVADLRIDQTELGWIVKINEDDLPAFQINPEYESVIPQSSEEKEALRIWSSAAKWLFRSLNRRRQILIEIGTFFLKKQLPYLSQKGNLKSFDLQDLATHLQVHESTLYRALAGKYAETPRGLIPLHSLLRAIPQTEKAKEKLCQLIASENKEKPLTDDQLSLELEAKGYKTARRTVAKYRKELNIASASTRKHLFSINQINHVSPREPF